MVGGGTCSCDGCPHARARLEHLGDDARGTLTTLLEADFLDQDGAGAAAPEDTMEAVLQRLARGAPLEPDTRAPPP